MAGRSCPASWRRRWPGRCTTRKRSGAVRAGRRSPSSVARPSLPALNAPLPGTFETGDKRRATPRAGRRRRTRHTLVVPECAAPFERVEEARTEPARMGLRGPAQWARTFAEGAAGASQCLRGEPRDIACAFMQGGGCRARGGTVGPSSDTVSVRTPRPSFVSSSAGPGPLRKPSCPLAPDDGVRLWPCTPPSTPHECSCQGR